MLKDYFKIVKGSGLRYKLSKLRYELKYAWQRAWRGYDDTDVLNLNDNFTEKYLMILKDLRKSHHGFPGSITNEEWESVLDKMIYHLGGIEESEDWTDFEEENNRIDENISEFFKLMSEWFLDLWD